MEQMNVPDEQKIDLDFSDNELPESVRTFRPMVYREGDEVCCILGPDKELGVFASADTIESALRLWNEQLESRINHHDESDEVARYIIDTKRASVKKVG